MLQSSGKAITLGFIFLTMFGISSTVSAQTIAVAGKKKITLKEFKERYQKVKDETINPPEPRVFLEDVIRYEIGVQEALKKNLNKDPKVKERFRQEMYKALVEKAIGQKVQNIQVTEKEMRQYYKSSPEIRTSHILIEFKPGSSKKVKKIARNRAQSILEDVKKSDEPFAKLANRFSDDLNSKERGGDLGYQSRVTLVPNYYKAAQRLDVGEIGGLVESQYGFHIIKKTGVRKYEQANKRQLRAAVFDRKRKVLFDNFFEKLKSEYPVKINSKLLRQLQE